MTTEKTPTPPPGMRILTDDELTKPLPMDAMLWLDDGCGWTPSECRGQMASGTYCYATAESVPPPTDWRKLCEELAAFVEDVSNETVTVCGDGETALDRDYEEPSELAIRAKAILTRAKAALKQEETK